MTQYTSIRATVEAAGALRGLAGTLMTNTQRRISLSDALQAACAVAAQYKDETIAALPDVAEETR
jgi:hypothetical protein